MRNRRQRPAHLIAAALVATALALPGAAVAGTVSFKDDIHPVIKVRCLECHQPGGKGYQKSGLDMRTYESLMRGTKFGPVITPGNAFTSNLMVAIEWRGKPEIRMPFHRKRLTACEINLFRRWINEGAENN